MYALCQTGKTIQMLEKEVGRKYLGDGSQNQYHDKPVWHNMPTLREFIAITLKINPKWWGKNRISDDFHKIVNMEINKLRKKDIICDWNGSKQFGIIRLVKYPENPIYVPVMSVTDVNSTSTKPTSSNVSQDLKQNFVSILTRGSKDNTYKFALARSLLDYCHENKSNSIQTHDIPYQYLSGQFLKYYWYQISKFKIKQDFHIKKTPMMVKIINDVFEKDPVINFVDLDPNKVKQAEEKILKKVFGHARSKTSHVVPKFQKLKIGNMAQENKLFYDYDDDLQVLSLKPQAFEFFQKNYFVLLKTVLLEWTKFLERVNTSLPMLVAKIEQDEQNTRNSLSKYRMMYLEHTDHCFYCCQKLEKSHIHVDHFIPWSYIFDDSAWNLVLTCPACNYKKSSALAQEEFMRDLIKRNQRYKDQINTLKHSLDILDTGKGWTIEIENHYTNCQNYGFGFVDLP